MVRAMRRVVTAILLVGCSTPPKPPVPTPTPVADNTPEPPHAAEPHDQAPPTPTKQTLAQAGIVVDWMDRAADPCVDFFEYACGNFVKTAQIPADRASWGAPQMVVKDSEDVLHKTLEDAAAAKGSTDPVTSKLGTYYAACMDEAAIEKAGIAPIKPLLDEIAKVKDGASAAQATIVLQAQGVSPFFGMGPTQDFADATQMIDGLDQAGLGLPDKKYYLESKGSMPKTRKAYVAHVARMFQLLGSTDKQAATSAANVMRIETALATKQQDDVLRRDPHAVYHRVERAGLEKSAPSFPWGELLKALDIPTVTAITVNSTTYYPAVAKMIATESPAALRDYLTWNVLQAFANDLGKAWVDEAFSFRKELLGQKELPARWLRCVRRTDQDLGELLAQSYVKQRFGGDSKARAVELTKTVLGAMRVELDNLPWMDDATRSAAKTKLDKMAALVGFPDKWRAYEFEITRTDFAKNAQAARMFEQRREFAKIGKPIDRFEWHMTPPTVNAYYDPSLNEIALPAGQLQPPFFGATFHPAVNFGSTGGGTIGHEMTHGFDDEGSQFDSDGNLRDWWSKTTKDKFTAATKCVVEQYGKYDAIPNIKLDGKLTAGENIADIGGVKLAFQAYQAWKTAQTTPVQKDIEGLSDDQVYYLAYAQSWCEKVTPEALELQAHSNPHSPPKWRVDGVIVNQPGFGTAYSCKAGAPMTPAKQCNVW
jgi:predicted metalloendopeptidase